jgi:enamine deaminase RidA (YjgF/YER057c/UK114 family)
VEGPVIPAAHQILNPESMAPAVGFAHAVAAAPGRLVFLGGQTAHDVNGTIASSSVTDQFDRAAANVVVALAAAGGRPEHLVSMQIFTTAAAEYRASLKAMADVYRRHFGRHYPAIAFFEVAGLFDEEARIELVCTAVIPD